jgi:hypothetical protein
MTIEINSDKIAQFEYMCKICNILPSVAIENMISEVISDEKNSLEMIIGKEAFEKRKKILQDVFKRCQEIDDEPMEDLPKLHSRTMEELYEKIGEPYDDSLRN